MKKRNIYVIFAILLVVLLSVYIIQKKYTDSNKWDFSLNVTKEIPTEQDILHFQDSDNEAIMLRAGERMRELNDLPNMQEVIAVINGYKVTRKMVESSKIKNSNPLNHYTDRDILVMIMRDKVLEQEADKRGFSPTAEEINNAIEPTMKALQENSEGIELTRKYIEGMGITEEKYIEICKETMGISLKRSKLKQSIKEKYDKEIVEKATGKGGDPSISFNKYYEQYTDKLVQSANIKIIDPDLRQLLKKK